jgi:cobalt-zinc-cadmium resistance protein CzcA
MTDPLLSGGGPGLVDRLVALALRNRLLVVIALVLVAAVGVHSLSVLPIDAVPDVTNVQVQVLTRAPGLGPLEVERLITTPVEVAMGGLPHLEQMRSVSRFGLSAITLVFEEGTDLYWARQLVGEHLAETGEAIPPGFGTPELGPPATGLGEIFQFELTGDAGVSLMDLRDAIEWQVAPALRQVPGVVEVNTFGGDLRTFTVEVQPDQLAARGLVLGDVFEALERNNLTVGGGAIERGPEQTLLRGVAQMESLDDVSHVVIRTTEAGVPITVGSVARLEQAPMQRQGAMTRDGTHEGVAGIALMGVGENSRVVAERLRGAVADLTPSLPKGIHLDVYYDRTELVDRTIETVGHNLLEGGILVVVVLLLTLGNLRGGLIAASAIPLAMLVALTGMVAAGVSGNLMSLGAIDFGLIVDGAVVMVEAAIHATSRARKRGEPVTISTIFAASREVAGPVVFAVGIIILVYVPILTLSGVEGKMFRPMALTVVFALIGSLLYALVAVPVLATWFLARVDERDTLFMRVARGIYEPILDRVIRHPRSTAVVAALTFMAGLAILPFMGAEFIPTLDEGALGIEVVRQPSASTEEAVRETQAMEAALVADFPDEVATVVSRTGAAEISTDPDGLEKTDVVIILKPRDGWTKAEDRESLTEAMQEDLGRKAPGMSFYFSQPIEQRTNELIEGVRADVALVVHGDDLATLRDLGDHLARVVGAIPGTDTVKVEETAGLPMLTAKVNPAAIARLGMDATDVLDAISVVGGREAGEVVQGQRRFPILVRLPAALRNDPARLATVPVGRADGLRVPLGDVVTLTPEEGPVQVSHEGGSRRLTVEVNVRGRDIASFVAEAKARIATEVPFPAGYRLAWGGTFQNLEGASARLEVLVPLVLLLIFVLLQAQFGSARMALLVYANVPVAASGGVFALAFRGLPLSISAGVGFITLFGIAVLNGIVLMSHMRRLQDEGRTPAEAAWTGARERLRTVVMTTLVAALGFVPMAVATSAGAEVQRPLATVVIGGLVTSTLLTLFLLPTLYAAWMPARTVREAA